VQIIKSHNGPLVDFSRKQDAIFFVIRRGRIGIPDLFGYKRFVQLLDALMGQGTVDCVEAHIELVLAGIQCVLEKTGE